MFVATSHERAIELARFGVPVHENLHVINVHNIASTREINPVVRAEPM
jgi:hypothetical protein